MTAVLSFVLSPVGRWVSCGVIALLLIGGVYEKGRMDGRAAYKAKIEREINNAVRKGDAARERALRDFDALPGGDDANGVPDDGQRRD